jgi:hypothetical protein
MCVCSLTGCVHSWYVRSAAVDVCIQVSEWFSVTRLSMDVLGQMVTPLLPFGLVTGPQAMFVVLPCCLLLCEAPDSICSPAPVPVCL